MWLYMAIWGYSGATRRAPGAPPKGMQHSNRGATRRAPGRATQRDPHIRRRTPTRRGHRQTEDWQTVNVIRYSDYLKV